MLFININVLYCVWRYVFLITIGLFSRGTIYKLQSKYYVQTRMLHRSISARNRAYGLNDNTSEISL